MHLNKRGWGLNEMLLWIALILVFLAIAIFYITRLYSGFTSTSDREEVISATKTYINNRFSDGLVPYEMMITLDTLRNETDIKISEDCNGYVIVKPGDNDNTILDKIDCE